MTKKLSEETGISSDVVSPIKKYDYAMFLYPEFSFNGEVFIIGKKVFSVKLLKDFYSWVHKSLWAQERIRIM